MMSTVGSHTMGKRGKPRQAGADEGADAERAPFKTLQPWMKDENGGQEGQTGNLSSAGHKLRGMTKAESP
jgi:hypothetical protein